MMASSAQRRVRKAVIPAAGLGTRFLPATKAVPKEMLPIVDLPTIQLVIDEAVRAGITDVVAINGRNKHAIEDHFDHAFELAQPVATVIAVAAIAGQIAQTRSIWMPRRRIDGAPSMPADIGARTRRASLELIHALAIGGVGAGWLWWAAPRIAALPMVPLAAAALVSSALATLAIAWLVIGVIDALLRHAAVGRALRMTTTEKRDDDRLSSVDPRWRRLARQLAAEPDPRAQLATATLLILGDDAAVAIAFDPRRQPIPSRVAVGRGVRATQLVALARRYRLAIHREPALASALVRGTGPVPEAHWPRLAELVAATRR